MFGSRNLMKYILQHIGVWYSEFDVFELCTPEKSALFYLVAEIGSATARTSPVATSTISRLGGDLVIPSTSGNYTAVSHWYAACVLP